MFEDEIYVDIIIKLLKKTLCELSQLSNQQNAQFLRFTF